MAFHNSFSLNAPGRRDPEYDVPLWEKTPPIQARGNLTFLEYMDLIEFLWQKYNPEILFQPMQSTKSYDPEKGYIIYSLESRVPKQDNTKPRHRHDVDNPDDSTKKIGIWTQSFNNIIGFTALHQNPRTAEETIEMFETFMMEATPTFIMAGIETLIYSRRISDNSESRYGEDLSARTLLYMVTTQKVITIDQEKLLEVVGEVKAWVH